MFYVCFILLDMYYVLFDVCCILLFVVGFLGVVGIVLYIRCTVCMGFI